MDGGGRKTRYHQLEWLPGLGRRIGGRCSAMSGASRAWKEYRDVARAKEKVEDLKYDLEELERECREEVKELEEAMDPMVEKLLRNKEDIYHDYEQPVFETCLAERFEVLRQQPLQIALDQHDPLRPGVV